MTKQYEWFGANSLSVPASNAVRKLWQRRDSHETNWDLQDKTKSLMESKAGYEKRGLELGLDFQPYLVWDAAHGL